MTRRLARKLIDYGGRKSTQYVIYNIKIVYIYYLNWFALPMDIVKNF